MVAMFPPKPSVLSGSRAPELLLSPPSSNFSFLLSHWTTGSTAAGVVQQPLLASFSPVQNDAALSVNSLPLPLGGRRVH